MSKLSKEEIKEKFPNRWSRISHAAKDKTTVFNSLLCHINIETLKEAFDSLDANKAVGTDGISKKEYGKNLEANLEALVARIHIGSYKPQTKKEILIPKANGKTRPIAISCFEDKLIEWVIGKVLSCMYEPIFIRNSFGFRENKSPHDAIKAVYRSLENNERPNVVEIDFASFFNSISHRKLMKILSKRMNDNRFKGLIGRFLKIGTIKQSGELEYSKVGTPQGSIMSPILANIFLNEVLDQWFVQCYASKSNIIVRYADDAIFFFENEDIAKNFVEQLFERIKRYDLELNEDKTNIIRFERSKQNTFNFLGFTFYWGKRFGGIEQPLKLKTRKDSLHKKIQEFDQWIKSCRNKMKLKEIWKLVIAKLKGHYNYYGYDVNRTKLCFFYFKVIGSLYKWLNRRSQKRSFNWKRLKRILEANNIPTPPVTTELRHLIRGWAYV